MRTKDWEPSPEEPDQPAGSLQIVVSSRQFDWLTKQCEFLGITKQQLVADVMDEWVSGNCTAVISSDPSAMVQRALDEFMRRHQDEFLSAEDQN